MKHSYRILTFIFLLVFALTASGCQAQAPGTPVPLPAQEPLEGWSQYQGNGITLWLPSGFMGGYPNGTEGDAIVQAINDLGDEYTDMATSVDKNRKAYAFFAFDPAVKQGALVTSVVAGFDTVKAGVGLAELLDQLSTQMPSQYKLLEKGVVELPRYQAGRILTELTLDNASVKQEMYVFLNGNLLWQLVYTCNTDQFADYQAIFEQSAGTLNYSQVQVENTPWFGSNPLVLALGFLLVLGGFALSYYNMKRRTAAADAKK